MLSIVSWILCWKEKYYAHIYICSFHWYLICSCYIWCIPRHWRYEDKYDSVPAPKQHIVQEKDCKTHEHRDVKYWSPAAWGAGRIRMDNWPKMELEGVAETGWSFWCCGIFRSVATWAGLWAPLAGSGHHRGPCRWVRVCPASVLLPAPRGLGHREERRLIAAMWVGSGDVS